MVLKIFVPDIGSSDNTKIYTPLLYPSFSTEMAAEELSSKYGEWTSKIKYVSTIQEADIVTAAFYNEKYILNNKKSMLDDLYLEAKNNNKLLLLFTGGDHGITSDYEHYHLYRLGGYLSKNKGNEFVFANFFEDPVKKYFNGLAPIIHLKPPKPLIGFCGQGQTTGLKIVVDLFRTLKRLIAHQLHYNQWDVEKIESTTYTRSMLLNKLEKSEMVDTNFIRHKKYRAGAKDKNSKENSTLLFYENMKQTHYNICYRGNGNFSVRLFETLACGRIPIIVKSDNNMIFPKDIDWEQFPCVDEKSHCNIHQIVSDFHAGLTNESFVQLQLNARTIWLNYLSYKGYMDTMIEKYLAIKSIAAINHKSDPV